MKILYRARAAAYFALSRSSRMLSTPVLDAASISKTSIDFPAAISWHEGQTLHGVIAGPLSQLRPLAKMRAVVVFPTPRGPEKRYAWPIRSIWIAFCRVWTIGFCPTTSSKTCGRNFLAMTWYLLMNGNGQARGILRHIGLPNTVASFRTWRVFRAPIAQPP